MLGDEQGKIRVVGLEGLVFIAVAVDRDDAVRVLIDDNAVGVHAEGTHIVLKFFRVIDDLALIELVGEVGEDDGGQLNAHADVDAVRLGGDLEIPAYAFHPFAAHAPDGNDALVAGIVRFADGDAIAVLLAGDGGDGGVEVEIDLVLERSVEI